MSILFNTVIFRTPSLITFRTFLSPQQGSPYHHQHLSIFPSSSVLLLIFLAPQMGWETANSLDLADTSWTSDQNCRVVSIFGRNQK